MSKSITGPVAVKRMSGLTRVKVQRKDTIQFSCAVLKQSKDTALLVYLRYRPFNRKFHYSVANDRQQEQFAQYLNATNLFPLPIDWQQGPLLSVLKSTLTDEEIAQCLSVSLTLASQSN